MSAASLDTSDPEIFIAIPRSAYINLMLVLMLVPRKASKIKGKPSSTQESHLHHRQYC